MSAFHTLVWIDHAAAHVYSVQRDHLAPVASIKAHDSGAGHVHHKAGTPGPGHNSLDPALLKDTTEALRDAGEILIVGPGQARHALSIHLDDHAPDLAKRVIGVEAMDRCSDGEMHAFAHPYFVRADRMRRGP